MHVDDLQLVAINKFNESLEKEENKDPITFSSGILFLAPYIKCLKLLLEDLNERVQWHAISSCCCDWKEKWRRILKIFSFLWITANLLSTHSPFLCWQQKIFLFFLSFCQATEFLSVLSSTHTYVTPTLSSYMGEFVAYFCSNRALKLERFYA